jgi:hypothetical protein
MPFYIKRDGKVIGPYARAELKDMLKHGEIRSTAAAKEDGDREWSTVEKCLRGEKNLSDEPSPIPARFRGTGMVPRSSKSSLGFAAYRKFAAATRHAARSVAGISLHGGGMRSTSKSVKLAPRANPAEKGTDYRRDLIFGAALCVGGVLATILGFVFAGDSPAGGLFWIFGGPALFGGFLLVRGIARFVAGR